MKQHITVEQLQELNEVGKKKLIEWCEKNKYMNEWIEKLCYSSTCEYEGEDDSCYKKHIDLPFLSIGQMIEFLDWQDMQFYYIPKKGGRFEKEHREKWCVQDGDYENANVGYYGVELTDALWEAVKKVLEKK